jgi:hypothetical protein
MRRHSSGHRDSCLIGVPFRRFTVGLVSSTNFTVDPPEALIFRAGTAVYIAPDGTPWWFDDETVEYLKQTNGARARRR